jgi:hypothetical protein
MAIPLAFFPIVTMTRTLAALKMRKWRRDDAPRVSAGQSWQGLAPRLTLPT